MLSKTEDRPFPQSKEEASRQGRTYFMAGERCPSCGHRFHWTHNGHCMTCHPRDGEELV